MIFLDQSQFLATHCNQSDCFILCRQQITSNGFFSCSPKWEKAGFLVIEKEFEMKKPKYYVSFLYKTNRFHVAERLFSNRSQMTSKCGKNEKVAHEAMAECVSDEKSLAALF